MSHSLTDFWHVTRGDLRIFLFLGSFACGKQTGVCSRFIRLFASLTPNSSNSKHRRIKQGMIAHAYNLSTQEDQARGLLQVRGQSRLHRSYWTSQSYIARPDLKREEEVSLAPSVDLACDASGDLRSPSDCGLTSTGELSKVFNIRCFESLTGLRAKLIFVSIAVEPTGRCVSQAGFELSM